MALLSFPASLACFDRAASRGRSGVALRWLPRLLLWLALAGPTSFAAPEAPSKEYQIKAVFLLNFIHFTDWPESAFASPQAPLRIAVLGEDPFGGALEAAVLGEKIGARPIVLTRFARVEEVKECHVVFVAKSEAARTAAIVARFAGQPVLTVGDLPDFARRGGIINFYAEGQKVRFEVNRAAAEQCGFKLSSQLLGLARIVGTAGQPPRAP